MTRALENFHRIAARKAAREGRAPRRAGTTGGPAGLLCGALLLGFSVFCAPTDAVSKAAIDCGTAYTVERGDTLFEIAERAYGNGYEYDRIYEANRAALASSARVDIGDRLSIPCAGGVSVNDKTSTGRSASAGELAPPPGDEIRFLTGTDFAPFVHPDLPGAGMVTELIRLAMPSAAPDRDFRILSVADWSRHFDLLERQEYDLGFPWYKPDCSKAGRLSASMQRRCEGFVFSDPLFAVAVGYYVRAGDSLAAARESDQLRGRRICRPADHFTFDLEAAGLTGPETVLLTPPDVADCLTWLDRGQVDVVTLSKPVAENEINRLGFVGHFAEAHALASSQTLHVVASRDRPEAVADLELVNLGLARLRASGRWFEVVAQSFGVYGLRIR